MESKEDIRSTVVRLLERAETLIPDSMVPNLGPMDRFPDVPEWHDFEHEIWKIGEEIRQAMNAMPKLRADSDLQERILHIAKNRRAKRGRQSFIMLLAYKPCMPVASALASELQDSLVDGHVIYTWRKMQDPSHVKEVAPFLSAPKKWVKDEAKKYIAKYGKA